METPKCTSTDEWIKKMWYLYTIEYYPAIKIMKSFAFWQHEWNRGLYASDRESQKKKNIIWSHLYVES